MKTVAIALPSIEADRAVEVSVRVNGDLHTFNYRVEIFQWADWGTPPEPRAETLKRILAAYDKRWRLVEIGAPDDSGISIMFRKVS